MFTLSPKFFSEPPDSPFTINPIFDHHQKSTMEHHNINLFVFFHHRCHTNILHRKPIAMPIVTIVARKHRDGQISSVHSPLFLSLRIDRVRSHDGVWWFFRVRDDLGVFRRRRRSWGWIFIYYIILNIKLINN
ncbi:hypothetical protein Hanom_Chr00s049067g01778851 [Helianthus anomalus]